MLKFTNHVGIEEHWVHVILLETPLNKNKTNPFRICKALIKQDYIHMKSIILKLLEKQQSKINQTKQVVSAK